MVAAIDSQISTAAARYLRAADGASVVIEIIGQVEAAAAAVRREDLPDFLHLSLVEIARLPLTCACACHRTGPRSPSCRDCARRHDYAMDPRD